MFYIFARGTFPGLLAMVGIAAEIPGVQAKFSGHLDLGIGQAILLASFDPDLQFGECEGQPDELGS